MAFRLLGSIPRPLSSHFSIGTFFTASAPNVSSDPLGAFTRAGIYSNHAPRWTSENRQFVDMAKPAIFPAAETHEFYFVASSVRKSVWTLVRQLRGPHLRTCA